MTVGENIKRIRKEKGLTQKQLGALCTPNISESTIRKYELGLLNPKIETQKKIAKALGIPVSLLSNDLEDMDNVECKEIFKLSPSEEFHNMRKKDLINAFNSLNNTGQLEAVKQVELLTKIPEYQLEKVIDTVSNAVKDGHIRFISNNNLELNAAHIRTDIEVTAADLKHDDDIMDDENF